MRCAHYALSPTAPVRALHCRRTAVHRVRCGTERVWAVCDGCLGALRVLWGDALREVAAPAGPEPDRET